MMPDGTTGGQRADYVRDVVSGELPNLRKHLLNVALEVAVAAIKGGAL